MYTKSLNIKSWAEEDRPREKLIIKGQLNLSNAELIAILIRSGNKSETAVELSKRLLTTVGNDLNKLGKLSLNDLKKINGIGEAKAASIIAALEIGRRRKETSLESNPIINSSLSAFKELSPILSDLAHEEFWVLYLNRRNEVIKKERISQGGVTGTVADTKIIFKHAIELLSSGIILAHNHPSGNLNPSNSDINLTKKLIVVGKTMDSPVLDHLIISNQNYYSFADNGLL